jgi:histone acetyltransferase (RNA polymerase elongator complex component)
MDDRVLEACLRGHTAKQAEDACLAIVKAGFSLTGQMMIGLPGASLESELFTAHRICALGATSARIYPTVVFHGTPLCTMTTCGKYHPLTVAEAVERSAAVLGIFEEANVPCIRIGLCASEDLISTEQVLAGPNHPALGELIWNEYYYQRLKKAALAQELSGTSAELWVEERLTSKIIGQRRCNLLRLSQELGLTVNRVIGKKEMTGFLFNICEGSRKT